MYILKTKYRQNVVIEDLGIVVMHNDNDGVLVGKIAFTRSKDAQKVKDKLIISTQEGDYSDVPEKNIVSTELDLDKIKNPREDMTVYIRNYMNSSCPAYAIYINGQWSLSVGGGENGQVYVHPATHPATMITTDENHRFVTDNQISKWNDKSDFSGDYNDLTNKPTIPQLPSLANVATSGDYNDLVNKPTIPELGDLSTVATSGDYNDLKNKPTIPQLPTLSSVATSGSYNDLIDKPTIPDISGLSQVAFSGDYNDLKNIPSSEIDPDLLSAVALSGEYNDLKNKPNLSTVATSGSYNDLIDKPVFPDIPTLADVATSGDYNDLVNKPDVYNKEQIDGMISASSGAVRYKASGNEECVVLATGTGVTCSKSGNTIAITVPNGVNLLSAQVHFNSTEIGTTGNCVIDYGMGTDYTNIIIPTFQVINDVTASRAYKVSPYPAANLNTNAHTLQLTGLTSNIGIWVKLTF